MLRKPGGVAGAHPAAEGQEGALTAGHAGWAAAIHGSGAAYARAGHAPDGGHCASEDAAAAQFIYVFNIFNAFLTKYLTSFSSSK